MAPKSQPRDTVQTHRTGASCRGCPGRHKDELPILRLLKQSQVSNLLCHGRKKHPKTGDFGPARKRARIKTIIPDVAQASGGRHVLHTTHTHMLARHWNSDVCWGTSLGTRTGYYNESWALLCRTILSVECAQTQDPFVQGKGS